MGFTVIAPVGDNIDALFVGMKEFATERVHLITPHANLSKAKDVEKKLRVFSISVNIHLIESNLMESMFSLFGQIISGESDPENIIVNVATGDRLSTCAALSAAFANGLKAFGVMDNKPMLLPIMRLSYYHELSESKLKVLTHLDEEEYIQLTTLSNKLKMSVSLLSYHINGTARYKGLIALRLVEVKEKNKHVLVRLSQMGRLILKGYIPCEKCD